MPLHRRRTQQQINLIIVIPVSLQILDYAKTALAIGDSCVEEVLFAVFVDGEALPQYQRFFLTRKKERKGGARGRANFEIEHPPRPELRLDRTRNEYGRLPIHHTELFLSVFHDGAFDRDYAGHFDCAAE